MRQDQTDWDTWVPLVVFGYNTSKHSSTGFTPFELCFGRQARLPADSSISLPPDVELATDYAKKLEETMTHTRELVDAEIGTAQARQQKSYDQRHGAMQDHGFEEKQWVLLYNPAVKKASAAKLTSKFKGP